MTPSYGKVGTVATFSVSSSGFSLDGDYTLRWGPAPGLEDSKYTVLKTGTIARGETSVAVSFTVPEAKYGKMYVQFVRVRDKPIGEYFEIAPSLDVKPRTVKPGGNVTISGYGFVPDDSGTITFNDEQTALTFTPDETGTFTVEYTAPDLAAGSHKFTADSPKLYTDTASAVMEIIPFITLEPENPEIGSTAVVAGKGFAPSSELEVMYDDIRIADSPTTDENGTFSYEFKVPESSLVNHIVTVTDAAGNSETFGMDLEGEAPDKPIPIGPKDQRFGWFGSQLVTFTWSEVSDASGVTYVVEIAENLNFFPLKPGMKKADLTESRCTATIEPGTYYWRVKAIDGAGNESEWSISPYPFKVGFISIWSIVAGAVIFLIVFVLLIRTFFRRLSEYYN